MIGVVTVNVPIVEESPTKSVKVPVVGELSFTGIHQLLRYQYPQIEQSNLRLAD